MQKILGYIALAIIAVVGLYEVMQLNNVSDVIAESNRKTRIEMAAAKAEDAAREKEQEAEQEYASENYGVPETSEFTETNEQDSAE
jgi:hypothetical protein